MHTNVPVHLDEAKALAEKFSFGFERTPATPARDELTEEDLQVDQVQALRNAGAL